MPPGLRGALERFVGGEIGVPVTVSALARWPGGTMRHAWAVDLEIPAGPRAGAYRLLYLEDRPGVPVWSRLPREHEFKVLSLMHATGVRVPRPHWCVGEGDPSGLASGLILERVHGETLTRRILRDPAFGAVRPRLLRQMGEELARIHAAPTRDLPGLPGPPDGIHPAAAQLQALEGSLRDIGEPHPALELGLRWLDLRAPRTEQLVVVHGDYRLGNLIVDPEEGLRAVLDWELSHLGDPGEDLAWVCLRFWRAVDRPATPALGPRAWFFDTYAGAAGRRLDPELCHYWEVLAHVRWAIITLGQARRHLEGGERSLELASIGRHCAEIEWDLLRLLRNGG